MILIIGGAYQGKLEFARNALGVTDSDIYFCTGQEIDFSFRCIHGIEAFCEAHPDPEAFFRESRMLWQNSILICRDISGGVVPLSAGERAWQRKTGRLCRFLAGEAAQVSRMFCGLEQRLK